MQAENESSNQAADQVQAEPAQAETEAQPVQEVVPEVKAQLEQTDVEMSS